MITRRQHEDSATDHSTGSPVAASAEGGHVSAEAAASGGHHTTFWDGLFDNAFSPFFAFAIAVWANVFTELWRRREKILAFKWGTEGFEEEESSRPHYYGTHFRVNPVTHREEKYFPHRSRWLRQVVSFGVATLWVGVILVSMYGEIKLEAWLNLRGWSHFAQAVIVACLSLVSILTMRKVYHISAVWLNDWENYRTNTDWEDALIYKVCYAPLRFAVTWDLSAI